MKNHIKAINIFIDKGIDTNMKIMFNVSLLHLTSIKGKKKLGSDVHARDCENATPLHFAASGGFINQRR